MSEETRPAVDPGDIARAALAALPQAGLTVFDADMRIVLAEGGAWEAVKALHGDVVGRHVRDILWPDSWTGLQAHYERVLAGDAHEFEFRHPVTGAIFWAQMGPLAGGGGVLVSFEITARRTAEVELAARLAQQSAIARLGRLALRDDDVDNVMQQLVQVVADTLGAELGSIMELLPGGREMVMRAGASPEQELIGRRFPAGPDSRVGYVLAEHRSIISADVGADERFAPSKALLALGAVSGLSVPIGSRDAPLGVLGIHSRRPHAFTENDLAFAEAAANIVAEAVRRRRTEDRLREQALHDALTGLPNRTLLLDRLEQALRRRRREGGEVAVLFLDVDDFKLVNDTLSHAAGDRLLRELGGRLSAAVRRSDTVARFGGDEFVVVAGGLSGEADAVALAQKLHAVFAVPFDLGGGRRHVASPSIGIALARDGEDGADVLLRDADTAMYAAKAGGRDRWEVLDRGAHGRIVDRMALEVDLRRALAQEDIGIAFQPLVELSDGRIFGAEALARWTHPERGPIDPAEFVALAEQTRLIASLGAHVLRAACREAARWPEHVLVSVNVSARQIGPDLPAVVAEALESAGLVPDRLMLEVTENALVESHQHAATVFGALRELGVRVALDDFGTGASSLTHLRNFPVDFIKIDRSFVSGATDPGGGDAPIVQAIIGIAWALGMGVIAEGIEREEQVSWLLAEGCHFGQGFRFAGALPPDELRSRLG